MDSIAFLGCSRGLGYAVSQIFASGSSLGSSLLVARSSDLLEVQQRHWDGRAAVHQCDFARAENIPGLLDKIYHSKAQRIFYFAGGGPHGLFPQKEWKDHQWGLQVSLLTPAQILHALLRDSRFDHVKQIIAVGSAIADGAPDPGAASYAAAKHGLRGLVESILLEGCDKDLRYFRPGYMDTDLLPAKSRPRQDGSTLLDPKETALTFVKWANDSGGSPILSVPS